MLAVSIKGHIEPGPEVIKKIMLNSAEHEILNAHKYKNIKKFSLFSQAQIQRGGIGDTSKIFFSYFSTITYVVTPL